MNLNTPDAHVLEWSWDRRDSYLVIVRMGSMAPVADKTTAFSVLSKTR